MTKLKHPLHGVGLLQLAATAFPHTNLTLNLLHPPKVALCASLGLRTEPMCPDNPSCTKKANYHGDMCHNSGLWASTVYSNWFSVVGFESVWVFYIHLQVIPNNSTRPDTNKQQDLQPISLLAADQLIHCRMSGSRFRMVQMEI